jgi:cyclomaltodextrinase / maltogenic alpha-amylase / neopullulanase
MSDWTERNIFWHVYPLAFTGAEKVERPEGTVVHRLPQLISWLDYAVNLGASALLLAPIFQSSSHGYDTIDYYVIDSRLGDDSDFEKLIAETRRRGLRVVLDGVFNHVGRDFPAFQRAMAQGPASPDAALFRIDFDRRSADGTPTYANFEDHEELPVFNHTNPAVADLVVEVMKH